MVTLKAINTGLSFFLEIAMLAAFGYGAFYLVENPWLKWVLAIVVPLAVFILWGLLLAPRAGQRTDSTIGIVVSLGLFYLAAVGLLLAGQPFLGAAMMVLAAVNRSLVVLWKQW